MAEQALIQFRADRKLKEETTKIFASLGFDMSTALRMFLVKARQVRGLPFEAIINERDLNFPKITNDTETTVTNIRTDVDDSQENTTD